MGRPDYFEPIIYIRGMLCAILHSGCIASHRYCGSTGSSLSCRTGCVSRQTNADQRYYFLRDTFAQESIFI